MEKIANIIHIIICIFYNYNFLLNAHIKFYKIHNLKNNFLDIPF